MKASICDACMCVWELTDDTTLTCPGENCVRSIYGAAVEVETVESNPAHTHILLSITSRESNFSIMRVIPPSKYVNLDSVETKPAAPCECVKYDSVQS
jgi:hypothetical protein